MLLSIISVAIYGLEAFLPNLIGNIISGIKGTNVTLLVTSVALLSGLRLFTALFDEIHSTLIQRLSVSISDTNNNLLISYIANTNLSNLDEMCREKSIYQKIMDNLILPENIVQFLMHMITQIIKIIIYLIIVLYLNPVLAGILFVASILSLGMILTFSRFIKTLELQTINNQSEYFYTVFDGVALREGIRAVEGENYFKAQCISSLDKYLCILKKKIDRELYLKVSNAVSANICMVTGIMGAAFSTLYSGLKPEYALTIIYISLMLGPSIKSICDQIIELNKNDVRIANILEFLHLEKQHDETNSSCVSNNNMDIVKIRLMNLTYKHKDSQINLINNLNISLSDSPIAFVGKSGSGKSSLAKLIAGLYKTNQGTIKYETSNGNLINRNEIKIVFVPQRPFIFSGSIYDNLVLHKQDVSNSRLINVLTQLKLDKRIGLTKKDLDKNFEQFDFSGGELQRINIARALIQEAHIVIYDEPTSSLDPETELIINDIIHSENYQCLSIVIAHKKTTIERCSSVLFFDETGIELLQEDTCSQKFDFFHPEKLA
jgi:ATP-binding cassette subfamily B protein